MKKKLITFVAALLTLAVFSCINGLAAESSFIDSFSLKDGNRLSGKPLDGNTVESGSAKWIASGKFVFADGGGLKSASPGGADAKLELPEGVTSLEISLDCIPSAEKSGWIGIGLNASRKPGELSWPGGLMLIVDSNGYGAIFADGTKIKLPKKKLDNFKPDAFNKLSLRYDRLSNSVWASVNGTELLADFGLNTNKFTPGLNFAGLSCYGTSTDAKFSNFSLKVNADASTAPKAQQEPPKGDSYRILFMGDSITHHQPAEKVKWTLACGMAASAVENDYVHKLCAKIADAVKGRNVEQRILANGGGVVRNYSGRIAEYKDYNPDLVIVQFGENERKERTLESFASEYTALLKDVKSLSPAPLVICVGTWSPTNGGIYSGWSAEVETTVERLAKENGADFAPVSEYARNPACRGFGETEGVRWHPNDKAMQGYADNIFAVWSKRQTVK